MKTLFSRIALLAVLGAFINSATAEVIYSYTGASPLIAEAHCAPNPSYGQCLLVSAGMEMGTMQASFSFDTALAANLNAQAMTPDAWSISANGTMLSNTSAGYHLEYQDFSPPTIPLPVFVGEPPTISNAMLVSTDSSGSITGWQFAVTANGWTEGNSYPGQPFAAYDPLRIASASDATQYFVNYSGRWCESDQDCDPDAPPEVQSVFVPGTDTLQFAATSSEYVYGHADATSGANGSWTATVVPVPAAAWLFVSALGLLGLRRKR